MTGRRKRRRDRDAATAPAQDICVWDERGEEYRCPAWIWADPSDVIEDAGPAHGAGIDPDGTDAEDDVDDYGDGEGYDIADKEMEQRSRRSGDAAGIGKEEREKGKEKENEENNLVIREGDAVEVRARFSDIGMDVVMKVGRSWTVKEVVKRLRNKKNVCFPFALSFFFCFFLDPRSLASVLLILSLSDRNTAKNHSTPPKKLTPESITNHLPHS